MHLHAVIRLDRAMPAYRADELHPPSARFTVELLERRDPRRPSRRSTRRCPDELGGGRVRWGDELDVRQLDADERREVAGYLAKYATKSTEQAGGVLHRVTEHELDALPVREHVRAYLREAFALAADPALADRRFGACAHALGYRGHCLTKSRRYSTTFKALRQAREQHVHEQLLARSRDADATRARRRDRARRELPATTASAISQPPTHIWPHRRPRERVNNAARRVKRCVTTP